MLPLGAAPGSGLRVSLRTPTTPADAPAAVDLARRSDGRADVMLTLPPATFVHRTAAGATPEAAAAELLPLLGLGLGPGPGPGPEETGGASASHGAPAGPGRAAEGLPPDLARGAFTHLIVPVRDLATVLAITPDYGAVAALCRRHGVDTVAFLSLETKLAGSSVHVRELAPAVGTDEVMLRSFA